MRTAPRFLALYACLASCSGGTRPASETSTEPPRPVAARPAFDAAPEPAPAGPYEVAQGLESGQIAGIVTLAADPPEPPLVRNACGVRAAERLSRTPAGGVSGALVYVADVRRGKGPPQAEIVDVALRGCRYEPASTMVGRAGARIRLANEDPTRHVFTADHLGPRGADAPELLAEIPAPLEGQRFEVVLERPGIIRLGCAVHADERAWVVVPDHPYQVISDADGRFAIDDVPVGEARLIGWHPPLVDGGKPLRGEVRVQVVKGITVDGSMPLASP